MCQIDWCWQGLICDRNESNKLQRLGPILSVTLLREAQTNCTVWEREGAKTTLVARKIKLGRVFGPKYRRLKEDEPPACRHLHVIRWKRHGSYFISVQITRLSLLGSQGRKGVFSELPDCGMGCPVGWQSQSIGVTEADQQGTVWWCWVWKRLSSSHIITEPGAAFWPWMEPQWLGC